MNIYFEQRYNKIICSFFFYGSSKLIRIEPYDEHFTTTKKIIIIQINKDIHMNYDKLTNKTLAL